MAEIADCPPTVRAILGHKFNRLTVVAFAGWKVYPKGKKAPLIECQCDCGKTTVATKPNVLVGQTQSCGCFLNQRRIEAHTKHGQARKGQESALYKVWKGMLQRCSDPNCESWKNYGQRGITVKWQSFEEFERDMAATYQKGLTIERDDFNGHYEKSNCRWIPRRQQNRNYRRNRFIEFNGERLPMVLWAERYGLDQLTLRMRLERGWPVEKAITTPLLPDNERITFNGETLLLADWSRRTGIEVGTLWARLYAYHWPVERALTKPLRRWA